jgi:hypothetical protein
MAAQIPNIDEIKSILFGEVSASNIYRLTINTVLHKYHDAANKFKKRMYYTIDKHDEINGSSAGMTDDEYKAYIDEIITESFLDNDHIRIDFAKLCRTLASILPGMQNPRIYLKLHKLHDSVKVTRLTIKTIASKASSPDSPIISDCDEDYPPLRTPSTKSSKSNMSWADKTAEHERKILLSKRVQPQIKSIQPKPIDDSMTIYEKVDCYRILMILMPEDELGGIQTRFEILGMGTELSNPSFDPDDASIILRVYDMVKYSESSLAKLKRISHVMTKGRKKFWRES